MLSISWKFQKNFNELLNHEKLLKNLKIFYENCKKTQKVCKSLEDNVNFENIVENFGKNLEETLK